MFLIRSFLCVGGLFAAFFARDDLVLLNALGAALLLFGLALNFVKDGSIDRAYSPRLIKRYFQRTLNENKVCAAFISLVGALLVFYASMQLWFIS